MEDRSDSVPPRVCDRDFPLQESHHVLYLAPSDLQTLIRKIRQPQMGCKVGPTKHTVCDELACVLCRPPKGLRVSTKMNEQINGTSARLEQMCRALCPPPPKQASKTRVHQGQLMSARFSDQTVGYIHDR